MLHTDIGARAKVTPAIALAAYDHAVAANDFTVMWDAAHMLAAALRKPKRATTVDLAAPIKLSRRPKHWGEFVIQWADGSDTLVRGVTYDDPRDRWAAAFQAADRLRRSRRRHAWEGEPGAPPRWTNGPLGVRIQTPAYEDYCRTRPLPAAVAILADDGETFSVGSADHG